MTELVRMAVKLLRAQSEQVGDPMDIALKRTSGIWCHGDGLAYQKKYGFVLVPYQIGPSLQS